MAKKILKSKDAKKLMIDLNSARKNLLNLRFKKATGQLEKTSQIKKTKKNIEQLIKNINQNKELKNA